MSALLASILPILLIDVLNPVLLGLMVFAAGTNRAVANSAALLSGHTIAYLLAGFAVSFGIERVSATLINWLNNPSAILFVISALLGLACLYWAFKPADPPTQEKQPEWEFTPLKCFGFGAVVNFVGVPFALPYFAAIDQILKADLAFGQSLTALVIYNIGFALPFAMVPVSVMMMGSHSKPILEKINQAMISFMQTASPWLLALLGLWLLFDAAYYFVAGEPLFYL